jgi:hypothetical protein
MASTIVSNLADRTKEAMSSARSTKVEQLSSVTKDVHDKGASITTDYGVKQSNTDDWLKIGTEDKNGPSLLEDAFAREKVRCSSLTDVHSGAHSVCRFTDLTMSVFQSAWSMPVAPLPSASSLCKSPLLMSLLLVS